MRQVGERQPVREPRAVCALGGVGGGDELARGAAAQAPAAPQLLRSAHAAEASWTLDPSRAADDADVADAAGEAVCVEALEQ